MANSCDDASYLNTDCLSPSLRTDFPDCPGTGHRRDVPRWGSIWTTMDAAYVLRVSIELFLLHMWCRVDLFFLQKKAQLPTVDDYLSFLSVCARLFSLPNIGAHAATLPKYWPWGDAEPPQLLNYSSGLGGVSSIFKKSEKHFRPLTKAVSPQTRWLRRLATSSSTTSRQAVSARRTAPHR